MSGRQAVVTKDDLYIITAGIEVDLLQNGIPYDAISKADPIQVQIWHAIIVERGHENSKQNQEQVASLQQGILGARR